MITIKKIEELDELLKEWDRLVIDRPKRFKRQEDFLDMLLDALQTALFFAYVDKQLAGFCTVSVEHNYGIVNYLPGSASTQVGLKCMEFVRKWAKQERLKKLFITTTKFSGSTQRYFKNLGFHRCNVTYFTEV